MARRLVVSLLRATARLGHFSLRTGGGYRSVSQAKIMPHPAFRPAIESAHLRTGSPRGPREAARAVWRRAGARF
jgi:hypothetical protein